jgi:hypothetical protein
MSCWLRCHRSGGNRGDSSDKFDAGIVATQNRIDSGKFSGAGAEFNPGNTGLNYLDPRRLIDPGSFTSTNVTAPGGFSYFGKFGENFNVAVALVASDSRANIMQRPRIQTSHAVPGSFFIGDSVPYASTDYGYGGIGTSYNRSSVPISGSGHDLGSDALHHARRIGRDGHRAGDQHFDGFEQLRPIPKARNQARKARPQPCRSVTATQFFWGVHQRVKGQR